MLLHAIITYATSAIAVCVRNSIINEVAGKNGHYGILGGLTCAVKQKIYSYFTVITWAGYGFKNFLSAKTAKLICTTYTKRREKNMPLVFYQEILTSMPKYMYEYSLKISNIEERSSFPINWASPNPLAQMHFEKTCSQVWNAIL